MKKILVCLFAIVVFASCGSGSSGSAPVSKSQSVASQDYLTKKPLQADIDKMVKLQTESALPVQVAKSDDSAKAKTATPKGDSQKPTETATKPVSAAPKTTQEKPAQTTNKNTDGFKTYEKNLKQEVEFVGNSKTKKFHYKDCDSVEKIAPGNVVILKSIEEALARGFVPCKRCNPR